MWPVAYWGCILKLSFTRFARLPFGGASIWPRKKSCGQRLNDYFIVTVDYRYLALQFRLKLFLFLRNLLPGREGETRALLAAIFSSPPFAFMVCAPDLILQCWLAGARHGRPRTGRAN